MRRHLAYFKYVMRHKWFVFIACRKVGGVSLWRSIIHDWHKFLPSEWFAYATAFYNPDGSNRYKESWEFEHAWNLHQKRGKHHWQHWLLTWDRGETIPVDMSKHFVAEMLADWWGAGRTITGQWDAQSWYEKNKDVIILSEGTRMYLEMLMERTSRKFERPIDIEQRKRILGC